MTDEIAERVLVPCCGQPQCYCECSPHVRDYALIVAAAMDEATPPMAADDPRRFDDPPF